MSLTVENETDATPAGFEDSLDDVLAAIGDDYVRRSHGTTDEPPLRGLELVREHRIGAVTLSPDLGGQGYSVVEFFDLLIRLAAADPDLAHILRLHFLASWDLQRAERAPGASKWLSRIAAGELIGGVTSELGTRPVGQGLVDTVLVRDGDRLLLRGRKFYSTGAQFSDHLRVTAVDENGASVAVYVSATAPGVVHLDDWDGIGQRHTGSGSTLLEDVEVDRDDVVQVGVRSGIDRPAGAFVQLYLHAIAAGILQAATIDAVDVVRSRARSYSYATAEVPTEDPEVLEVVGEIDATAFAVGAAVRAAAAVIERSIAAARLGPLDPALEREAALAAARTKVAVERPALAAASSIFDAGGASAIRIEKHLDRHWRNLRTLFSHNPTIYKARVLGDVAVNDAPLPESGLF